MNEYDSLSTREYLQALFAGKIPLRGAKGISYIMPDDGSGGGYSYLNRYFGGNYDQQSEEMQKMADEAGIENIHNYLKEGLKKIGQNIGVGFLNKFRR